MRLHNFSKILPTEGAFSVKNQVLKQNLQFLPNSASQKFAVGAHGM